VFIQNLQNNPFFFFAVVLTVIISIVLHELAHGWAAIRRGDRTPIDLNRMTGNPLVHMGPFSLLALFIAGIAWGQMPIDPTRMRGKYAEASVAAAGPAMNLLLAFVSLTALGLAMRFGAWEIREITGDNAPAFLFIFGSVNVMLCLFNLMPVPPLDGSRIAANFHRGYADFMGDPSKQGVFILGFIFVFMMASSVYGKVYQATGQYIYFLATLGM